MIRTHNQVALYARFSSDNQRSESIDAQLRAMKAYCKQHDFEIVKIYTDEAKSATTDRRPAFQQMISDSSKKEFNILLVHKLDRFARNRYDSAVYKRELKKNGVTVYSVLENLDDSPESIMMEAVLEGMAEYYSQNLGREVMKGLKETALQCKHTGGTPALGYDVDADTRRLIVNETEADTVRLIFDMYANGYGYNAILKELHLQNRLTKRGVPFRKTSLYSILTNPKYLGVYIFNRSSAKSITGTRNSHMYKSYEDIIAIEGGCPQIVDKVTYDKVQDRITKNKHNGGRYLAKTNYLLSGKVFCKNCGKSMNGSHRKSGRNKRPYTTYACPTPQFQCNNREINKDYLEKYVIELLEQEILNAKSLGKLAKKIEKALRHPKSKAPAQDFGKELAKIEGEIANVADAIAQGLISPALTKRLAELEEQKAAIETSIKVSPSAEIPQTIDAALILGDYNTCKCSPSLPPYKLFIANFIEKIEVGKYVVDITLKKGLGICPELDEKFCVRRQEIYEKGKGASS